MLNELLILTKIKAGDIKAFEELFRCYYSPLCWYAASITGRMRKLLRNCFMCFGRIGNSYRFSSL